jgi:HK97 gp10 family phage protein
MDQSFGHTGIGGRTAWGQIELSDFVGKLKALYPGIEQDEVYPKAIRKGAQLLADRMEQRTPIRYADLGRTGTPSEKYKTKHHVKTYHPPGTARKSVIVYQRKGFKSFVQSDVNANISYLVGYEKKMAFYMYWREVGNKFQPARPVIRPVFDAGVDEALQIALEVIQKDHEKRLGG